MITIDKVRTYGFEEAVRGMRNSFASWDKSDSKRCMLENEPVFMLGKDDFELMKNLGKKGGSHAKHRRMIVVYADITAPLYWWKEFDTYKVGTVALSTSTMHSIAGKEFTAGDFSVEHIITEEQQSEDERLVYAPPKLTFEMMLAQMNYYREKYLGENNREKAKEYWWQMIQLLPSSYNQLRTVMMNYEVLASIYKDRKNHRLDEWREFCAWIEKLPYSEIITGGDYNG